MAMRINAANKTGFLSLILCLAAALAVPFVGWLGFATLLAERIWRDNPAEGRCTA